VRALVGILRHRCASVPPSTLLAALALAAAVLWSWHLWQAQVQQVRMPVGRTESVITTLGSFSARLPAGLKVAAGGAVTDAIGLLVIEGVATSEGTGRHTPVRVQAVDDQFWTFHQRSGESPGAGTAIVTTAVASDLGVSEGTRLRLMLTVPSDIPLGSVMAAGLHAQPVDVRIAAIRPAGPGDVVSIDVEPQAPRTVYVSLSWMQRQLELAGRINAVLLRFADDARRDDGSPPADEVIMRAWLAAAALPDHGVRIRRVPGDNVMALDALGGVFDPALATRVMTALTRAGRPAVPALSSVGITIRAGDRVIPASTVTAIDTDAYLALSLPSGPARPGDAPSGTDDALLRSALQVNVGRGGVRVGRVQVTEVTPAVPPTRAAPARTSAARVPAPPAPDGPVWLNEWAAAALEVSAGDQVQLSWPVWLDTVGIRRRQGTFEVAGTLPMMRIGGDRSLLPDVPFLSAVDSPRAWPDAWRDPGVPLGPEDEAYWRQWNTAPKVLLPLERGQQLLAAVPGALSSIRFALSDADLVAAAVRDDVTSRVRLSHPGQEAAARLQAGSLNLLQATAPLWVLALLLGVWMRMAMAQPGATQRRHAAILSMNGLTRADIADEWQRRARVPLALSGVVATLASGAALLAAARPLSILDIVAVVLGAALATMVPWLALRSAASHFTVSGVAPMAIGEDRADAHRPHGRGGIVRWTRMTLAVALALTAAWHLRVATAGIDAPPSTGDGPVLLRFAVPRAVVLTPSTPDARAVLGLDEQPAWARATVASVSVRDGAVPVLGLPPALAALIPLPGAPAEAPRAWPTRWPRLLGVARDGQPQSLDPRDAEAVVATAGAVPPGAAVLPAGLLVDEQTFARAFPLNEGTRDWMVVAAAPDAEAIGQALVTRLGMHGVRLVARHTLPAEWRVR
jgi:hypothetical protein